VRRLFFPALQAGLLAAGDAVALTAFAALGIVTHRAALPLSALAEDALPLLVGWFAAALVFRPYHHRTWRPLLLTWSVGVPLGVLLRAALLGRLDELRQLAFLVTSLVLSLVFVLAARAAAGAVASGTARPPGREPGGRPITDD
jgi:hypothetical protein